MIRALFPVLLLSLVVLIVPPPALGDEPTAYVSTVVREAFAVRHFDDIRLPQGTVRAVHVGSRGFLWVGTREGLVRYKSGRQHIFPQSTDGITGLPSNMINMIHEDPRGNIWVATDRGVAVKRPEEQDFRVVTRSDDDREEQLDIAYFAPSSQGLIAVSASGDLLLVTPDGCRYLRQRGGGPYPLLTETRPVTAELVGDTLYIGTVESRLYEIALEEMAFTVTSVTVTDSPIVELEWSEGRLMWLERDNGLVWRNADDTLERWNPLDDESQSYYRAMVARSPRSLWLAAGPNVIRVRGDQTDVVRLPGRGNEVRSITRDRTGNIWIGSYYGLYYGLDTDFNSMQTAATYDAGVVSSLAANSRELFIGGQNLWVGDTEAKRYTELSSRYPAGAMDALRVDPQSIAQDPVTALSATDELLLVGYFVGGLDVVDLQSGAVTPVTRAGPGGPTLDDVGISSLLPIGNRRWLATMYLYGLVEITAEPQRGQAPRVSLRKLADQPTLIGVYRIDESRFLAVGEKYLFVVDRAGDGTYDFRRFESEPPGLVFAVAADGAGGAYLGIENGGIRHLPAPMFDSLRFNPDRLALADQFLGQRTVWHLLLDSHDTLWATTNNGVYVFDLPRERLVSHLTYRDGLPSNEFEFGTSAFLKTGNDEKIFLSSQGPVAFDTPVQPQEKLVGLTWASLTVDGESIATKLEQTGQGTYRIVLPYAAVHNSVLRLEYGFDDHIKALDASYVIRNDADGPWLEMGQPALTVTGAQSWDPLHIDFAMLSTSEQLISEPLHVDVILTPPWYMLWRIDMRVAAPILLAVGLLVLTLQYRARRDRLAALHEAEQRREIMEAEMRGRLSEKEILLREIHHRVGNILSNFAANVRGMQRSARSPETRDTLEHLNARIKVQSAVHMLLQRSDSTDINVANMIRQVVAGSRDFMGDRDPRPIPLQLDDVYMTYSKAQYLGLIVNELVTNSYKYATGSPGDALATVCLCHQEDGTALFEYRDYGPGPRQEDIDQAMARHRKREGGLQQVVSLVRELKGEPVIEGHGGMQLSFYLSAQLLHSAPTRDETAPEA